MTNVEQLLRQTLAGLADEGRTPALGERVLAGARRRRRRRVVAGVVTVLAAVVLVASSVLLLGPGANRSTEPVTPIQQGRQRIDVPGAVVDFYQDAMDVGQTWLLDPDTDRYEVVDHRLVLVTPDRRYAIVADNVPCPGAESICQSYGRYDVASGEVQSYDITSEHYGCVAGSPDGSIVVFCRRAGSQGVWRLTELLFIEIETGQQRSFPIREHDGWLPNDLVGWTVDGQGLIVTGLGPAGYHLGADLLYRLDGSVAAVHAWSPGGKTSRVEPVLGTSLIARMPIPGADEPVEVRDATTGAVIAVYSHEQMLRSEMVTDEAEIITSLSAWISDHEVVGQRGFTEVVLADLRNGEVRTVARIPGDGGGIHLVPTG